MPKGSAVSGTKRRALNEAETHDGPTMYNDPADRMALKVHHLKTTSGKTFNPTPDDDDLHKFGQYKGVNISIEMSDTFVFDTPEDLEKAIKYGPADGTYLYSRRINPTVQHLGDYLAAMEGTESAYCTASGMSAITAVFLQLCNSGDHVVAAAAVYDGAQYLLDKLLREKYNVETHFVDITNLEAVRKAIKPGRTKVLYFDSIANPALIVADIPKLAAIAHDHTLGNDKVQVVVDNTFAPMLISPKRLGADIVIHSLTKYVSGEDDIMGGAICGTKKLIKDITSAEGAALLYTGPVLNPQLAFQLLGRMAHLGLRVKAQNDRANELVHWIQYRYPELDLNYPGLKQHCHYSIIDRLRNEPYGYGGVFCIDMKTKDDANLLVLKLKDNKFGFLAESLGYYDTLLTCPGAVSDESIKSKNQPSYLSPGLIRICCGYVGTLELRKIQFTAAYEEYKEEKRIR